MSPGDIDDAVQGDPSRGAWGMRSPLMRRQTGAANFTLVITLLLASVGIFGAAVLYLNPVLISGSPPPDRPLPQGPDSDAEDPPLLRLVGSNTIGSTLAPALAKAYMEQRLGARGVTIHPGPEPHERRIEGLLQGTSKPQRIEVVATGSGFAFSALERGQADIGLSSRAISFDEERRLSALGNMRHTDSEHVLGMDGIAVIVHPDSPVAMLTLEQVGQVFDGTIKNWREIGGPNLPIRRYARNRESGTYQSFLDMVLKGHRKLSGNTRHIIDSRELSDAVANDPKGIGFVGLPYIGKAKALKLAALHHAPFPATPLTVYREDYPLSRRLYLYTPPNPGNAMVADFLDFALSPAGQALVEDTGFVGQKVVPVAPSEVIRPLPADVPQRYVELSLTADAVPFTIRFKANGAEPDNKAWRDLPRLIQLLISPQYRNREVILATFGKNAVPNAKEDPTRAAIAKLKAELERNGVRNVTVEEFGHALPVASDDTPGGREKNRRVELWLTR